MLPASSCSHLGAFSFSLAALAAGAPSGDRARPSTMPSLARSFRGTRPTVMSMLPATLLHLIREPGTTADDFASLRLCRSGGDKVPAELEKEFTALTGQQIHEGYGMTEIGIAANNPPTGLDKLGSIGLPNPGFVFSIRAEEGGEVRRRRGRSRLHHRAEPLQRLLERRGGNRRGVPRRLARHRRRDARRRRRLSLVLRPQEADHRA